MRYPALFVTSAPQRRVRQLSGVGSVSSITGAVLALCQGLQATDLCRGDNMKFKGGPHYGIDEDFYCMVFWTLRVCPAAQERAQRLCAEIAGDHAASLYECVVTGETVPDVEQRHGLTVNTLTRYIPLVYRRMCGESVGVWEPQQLPEWGGKTPRNHSKTTTGNG